MQKTTKRRASKSSLDGAIKMLADAITEAQLVGVKPLTAKRALANAKTEADASIKPLLNAQKQLEKAAAGVRFIAASYEKTEKNETEKSIVSARLSLVVDELSFDAKRVGEIVRSINDATAVFCTRGGDAKTSSKRRPTRKK